MFLIGLLATSQAGIILWVRGLNKELRGGIADLGRAGFHQVRGSKAMLAEVERLIEAERCRDGR